mmetsp:Transcript_7689/g.18836  ORF Transcript_7689/g.18836 Transcript_7689/m.18836 type:complete len:279 (+) Transcript_7689:2740-3576(+)
MDISYASNTRRKVGASLSAMTSVSSNMSSYIHHNNSHSTTLAIKPIPPPDAFPSDSSDEEEEEENDAMGDDDQSMQEDNDQMDVDPTNNLFCADPHARRNTQVDSKTIGHDIICPHCRSIHFESENDKRFVRKGTWTIDLWQPHSNHICDVCKKHFQTDEPRVGRIPTAKTTHRDTRIAATCTNKTNKCSTNCSKTPSIAVPHQIGWTVQIATRDQDSHKTPLTLAKLSLLLCLRQRSKFSARQRDIHGMSKGLRATRQMHSPQESPVWTQRSAKSME